MGDSGEKNKKAHVEWAKNKLVVKCHKNKVQTASSKGKQQEALKGISLVSRSNDAIEQWSQAEGMCELIICLHMKQTEEVKERMEVLAQKVGFKNPSEYCEREKGVSVVTQGRNRALGNTKVPSWAWRSVNTLSHKVSPALLKRFVEAYAGASFRSEERDRKFTLWLVTIALR